MLTWMVGKTNKLRKWVSLMLALLFDSEHENWLIVPYVGSGSRVQSGFAVSSVWTRWFPLPGRMWLHEWVVRASDSVVVWSHGGPCDFSIVPCSGHVLWGVSCLGCSYAVRGVNVCRGGLVVSREWVVWTWRKLNGCKGCMSRLVTRPILIQSRITSCLVARINIPV